MADAVILRYLFIFLLIKACCASLPGPNSLNNDELSGSTQGPDAQRHEDDMSINQMVVRHPDAKHKSLDFIRRKRSQERYKCHQCEQAEQCSAPCGDALFCYKSSVRDVDGTLHHSRGCSTTQDNYPFTCWTAQLQGYTIHYKTFCYKSYTATSW